MAAAAGLASAGHGRYSCDGAAAGSSIRNSARVSMGAGEVPQSPMACRPPLPPKSIDLARMANRPGSTDGRSPGVRRSFGSQAFGQTLSSFDAPVRWSNDSASGTGGSWGVPLSPGISNSASGGNGGRISGALRPLRLSLDPRFQSAFASAAQAGFAEEWEEEEEGEEGEEGDLEAALAELLEAETAAGLAAGGDGGGIMPARLSEMSRQLVDIAASLSPANADMLLDRGYSMVVPVLPASIYEHTLVARPNFKLRWVG